MGRGSMLVLWAAIAVGGCGYDFDAAFSQSAGGGGSGATSNSGGDATGGATQTGGGGTGGTAAGIPPGNEDCFNGIDDDADDLIDCEDDDCTNGACYAAPPAGWAGPVAFAGDDTDRPLPGCGATWDASADGNFDLDDPDAICGACGCGTASVNCSIPSIPIFTAQGCGGTLDTIVTPMGSGTCTPFNPSDLDSFTATTPTVQGASCLASGGAPTLPEIEWDKHSRICSDTTFGMGCGAGLCVPQSPSFAVCITQAGDHSCPDDYPDKTVLYDGFSDNRGCSDCACGSPSNVQCGGLTELWYSNINCNGSPTASESNQNNGCESVGLGSANSSLIFTASSSAGPCPTSGGQPEGEATPTEPFTVCCAPS